MQAAITMANAAAISTPINKHTIMAPEAMGMPKCSDEADMEKDLFWVRVSESGADIPAINKNVISMLAIKSRFLLWLRANWS